MNNNSEDIHLNDIWTFHFHDPNNDDWTLTSYQRLQDVSTVQDFWKVHNNIKNKLKNGMFFLMREYVHPSWDDENNICGGCLSIKVLKENLVEYWEKLCIMLLGENLLKDDHAPLWDIVNGISTSPKKYFCIIKIWLKDNQYGNKDIFKLPSNHHGVIIYRENIENIQRNNETTPKSTSQDKTTSFD